MSGSSYADTTRAGISREYSDTFLVDEARLRKLANVLEESGRKLAPRASLHFAVTRSDNSFYSTKDIDVVLGDDNTAARAIVGLELWLEKPTEQSSAGDQLESVEVARVSFGTGERERFFRYLSEKDPVRFTVINEDRDWCFLLADELDGQIKRVLSARPRWFPAEMIDRLLPLIFTAAAFLVAFVSSIPNGPHFTKAAIAAMSSDQRTSAILNLLSLQESRVGWQVTEILGGFTIAFIMGIALGELRPVTRLWRRVYAPTFYWGDMIVVRDRSARVFNNLKWSVLVAFAVSLIASFVYAWLIA
jgi:hypothetical protein